MLGKREGDSAGLIRVGEERTYHALTHLAFAYVVLRAPSSAKGRAVFAVQRTAV